MHVPDAVRILGDAATGTPVLTHSHSVGFPVCLMAADCYQTMREMLPRCANADKVSVTGKGKTPKCGSCGNQSFLRRTSLFVNKGQVRALKRAECIEENIKDVHEVQYDANKHTGTKVKTLPPFTNSQR